MSIRIYDRSEGIAIPVKSRSKILRQLKNGIYFNLSHEEWYEESDEDFVASPISIYKEPRKGLIHVKLTNDDRRQLVKQWKF